MELDEVIKMYTNSAEYERTHGSLQACLDFRQLAEWLEELKRFREKINEIMYIPENATNGEVLCMLFPNMHYTLSYSYSRVSTTIGLASSFDMDWWNTAYKVESDGEE